MASSTTSSSSDNSEDETSRHSDLPHGSERYIIEYYFHRGFTYRHITLLFEKQHNIVMNQRTLKHRLKDYGLTRREEIDDELKR